MLECERILRPGLSSLLTFKTFFKSFLRASAIGTGGRRKTRMCSLATSNLISPKKGQSTKVVSKWKSEHVLVRVGKEGFSSA